MKYIRNLTSSSWVGVIHQGHHHRQKLYSGSNNLKLKKWQNSNCEISLKEISKQHTSWLLRSAKMKCIQKVLWIYRASTRPSKDGLKGGHTVGQGETSIHPFSFVDAGDIIRGLRLFPVES